MAEVVEQILTPPPPETNIGKHVKEHLNHDGVSPRGDAAPAGADTPHGFAFEGRYLVHQGFDGVKVKVSTSIRVTARVQDFASDNWGTLFEFEDEDGVKHEWAAPAKLVVPYGARGEFIGELARRGLVIWDPKLLLKFIDTADPTALARIVSRTGWHDNVFVLPLKTIGEGTERVLLAEDVGSEQQYATSGTLEEWKLGVAALATGNSRLMLGLCASFAAPLLSLVGESSFGLHFVGHSSVGKSTILGAALSVWDRPVPLPTWHATANGLESVAALHSHTLLVLDELKQLDAREVGAVLYMLGNGVGKSRMTRSGSARRPKQWATVFLSSGEIGIAQHMNEAGKRTRAGQEVRMLEIAADAGCGHGVYGRLHDCDGGAALSTALTAAARAKFGTAGRAFVAGIAHELSHDRDNYLKRLHSSVDAFSASNLSANAGGQAHRACAHIALLASAGELAVESGVAPWEAGEAREACAQLFQEWLQTRGGSADLETEKVLGQVREFLDLHGASRFEDMHHGGEKLVARRAGFRRSVDDGSDQEYLVFPDTYRREVCGEYQAAIVTKILRDAGWLVLSSAGETVRSERLPGMNRRRVYVLRIPPED